MVRASGFCVHGRTSGHRHFEPKVQTVTLVRNLEQEERSAAPRPSRVGAHTSGGRMRPRRTPWFVVPALVGALLALAPIAPASAVTPTVTRTPWQMHIDPSPHGDLGYSLPHHGHVSAYAFANVPSETASSWQSAPDPEVIGFDGRVPGFGGGNASRLWSCMNVVDYTYFQTIVTIPQGVTVSQFSVSFNGIDDGARISVYNTDHPTGLVVAGSYVYLGGSATSDLSQHLVTGSNRVVITQVDDCRTGNNLSEARIVVNNSFVPPAPPNTAPTVAVTGVADGASYEIGAVPAAGCAASDAEDGTSNPSPVTSPITGGPAGAGVGLQTATCSVTDAGGLSATASATYTIVDTVAPTLSGAPTTDPNAAGWYSGPVTISWTAGDVGSGVDPATEPADGVLSDDGVGQTASATVADRAGNETTAQSSPAVNIDGTDPEVAFSGSTSYGLLDTVSITCSASDALSGIATSTCESTTGSAWSFGPGTHARSATATDDAGNSASATTSFEVTATSSSVCGLVHAFTGHKGTRTSLCAHLTNFERARSGGRSGPAAAQLDAFRKEATSRTGKQLTSTQVAALIAWADTL
jgi:hypothetical protein